MSANPGNWYLQDVDLASVKSCVCRMLLFEGRSALVKKTNVECFWAEHALFDNFVWVISGTAGRARYMAIGSNRFSSKKQLKDFYN